MEGHHKQRLWLATLIVSVVILCLASILQISHRIGSDWHGIPPSVIDDDVYYYARMADVAKGHPYLGNPYFNEYKDSLSPAFFVPDWINGLPLLLGLPLIPTIIFNFIFWALIFSLLAYYIGREYGLSPPTAAFVGIFSFIETYWLIMRPVAMQVVFPSFLFFLLAFIFWLKSPEKRRNQALLIVSGTLTFYLYTYLWQIVCVIFGLAFIHFLFRKQWGMARKVLAISLSIAVLSIPIIIYTVMQIQSPFYWQTIFRIGLITTHLPTIYAYQYGRWAVILLGAILLLNWRRSDPAMNGESARPEMMALAYSGLGLLIMIVSNAITGKELETALHIGRFVTLWVALSFGILVCIRWKDRDIQSLSRSRKISIIILLILTALFLVSNLRRSLPFAQINRLDLKSYQEYAAPLEWLNQNAPSSVVWADESISQYIPIMTRSHVLWDHLGALHLMPSREVEDRFLAAWMGTSTPSAELVFHYREYEGAGAVWEYTDQYYKNKLRCYLHSACQTDKSLEQWIGPDFLTNIAARQQALKADLITILYMHSVSIAIADKKLGEDKYLNSTGLFKPVWSSDRFVIYRIETLDEF